MRKLLNYITKPLGLELIKPLRYRGKARHQFITYAYSQEDQTTNEFLVTIAMESISRAFLTEIDTSRCDKNAPDFQYFNIYPGEHYRLLKALCETLAPNRIVEIGTFTGMGTLAIHQGSKEGAEIVTFDISDWKSFQTQLTKDLFSSGRISQLLSDLSLPESFQQYRTILEESEFIFCDGPKDGRFEHRFLQLLANTQLAERPRILMLDDIRFPNMIDLWRSIESPKLDITSFGHFSGSGLVDISKGLLLR